MRDGTATEVSYDRFCRSVKISTCVVVAFLQLKQEILETYRQLQRLSLEVRGRGDQWSPEAVEINDLKAGQLLLTLTELRTLIYERLHSHLPPVGYVAMTTAPDFCIVLHKWCCTTYVLNFTTIGAI